jgi:hypothetical protein
VGIGGIGGWLWTGRHRSACGGGTASAIDRCSWSASGAHGTGLDARAREMRPGGAGWAPALVLGLLVVETMARERSTAERHDQINCSSPAPWYS